MISKEQLLRLVADEVPESLVGIVFRAIRGLLAGDPPEAILSKAERELLADYAQQRLDRALGKKPVPGTGE